MAADPVAPGAQRIQRVLTAALILSLVALLGGRLVWERFSPSQKASQKTLNQDYGQAPDFTLKERSGRFMSLADLKGKVWIADFIFTRCQGPCPLQSARMAKLQTEFSSSPSVRFVSFSVDPSNDTPEVLSRYADQYGADPQRWSFLTGETGSVYDLVLKGFRLSIREETDSAGKNNGQVVHSLSFVLMDKEGKIRGYYEGGDEKRMETLSRDIKGLL